ncbi:protein piccolo-like [Leucoraja erinacea]|uniref:protein piccolo-like n=1 Tax=Leucoraja erinaceus TaxID=7782 RepID=UPI002455F156|nr:protein piccolo-like [Leucoraja erinacea]
MVCRGGPGPELKAKQRVFHFVRGQQWVDSDLQLPARAQYRHLRTGRATNLTPLFLRRVSADGPGQDGQRHLWCGRLLSRGNGGPRVAKIPPDWGVQPMGARAQGTWPMGARAQGTRPPKETGQWGPVSQEPGQWGPAPKEPGQWGPAPKETGQWGPVSKETGQWGPAPKEPGQWGPAPKEPDQWGPLSEAGQWEPSAEEPSQWEPSSEPEYKRQLYRLFGREVAETFLHPDPARDPPNPSVQQLLQRMGGQVTAERLWRCVREGSGSRSSQALVQAGVREQAAGRRPPNWASTHQRAVVEGVRRDAERQQERAAIILNANPLTDINDSAGREGPRRFLHPLYAGAGAAATPAGTLPSGR